MVPIKKRWCRRWIDFLIRLKLVTVFGESNDIANPLETAKKAEAFFHKWDMSTMFKHVSEILKALPSGGSMRSVVSRLDPFADLSGWAERGDSFLEPPKLRVRRWKRCPFRSLGKTFGFHGSRVAVNWNILGHGFRNRIGGGQIPGACLWFPSRVRGSSDGLPKQSLCHDTSPLHPCQNWLVFPGKTILWRQDRGQNHRIWALRWRPAATTGPRDGFAL